MIFDWYSIDPTTVAVLAIIFAATLMQSTFGFGTALVAMPLLPLVIGIRLATPLVALLSTTLAVLIVARDWRSIDTRNYKLLLYSFVGVPFGLFWLKRAPEELIKGVLALVIIGFALFRLSGSRRFQMSDDRHGFWFAFSAGLLGGAYNTFGVPLVVYGTLRDWSREHFRATMQGYFVPMGLTIVVGHWLTGLWTPVVFRYYLLGLPILLMTNFLGTVIHQRVSVVQFTFYIYVILLLLGINLLIQASL